jgi:plastocyanin
MKRTTLFTIAIGLAGLQATPALAKDYVVKAVSKPDGSYAFQPEAVTIQPGDTVTWENNQDDVHNVMAEKLPKGTDYFESPMFEKKGDKWSYTFKKPGTYVYHCHPHADNDMRGTIIVGQASEAVPAGGGENHHGASSEHKH